MKVQELIDALAQLDPLADIGVSVEAGTVKPLKITQTDEGGYSLEGYFDKPWRKGGKPTGLTIHRKIHQDTLIIFEGREICRVTPQAKGRIRFVALPNIVIARGEIAHDFLIPAADAIPCVVELKPRRPKTPTASEKKPRRRRRT